MFLVQHPIDPYFLWTNLRIIYEKVDARACRMVCELSGRKHRGLGLYRDAQGVCGQGLNGPLACEYDSWFNFQVGREAGRGDANYGRGDANYGCPRGRTIPSSLLSVRTA